MALSSYYISLIFSASVRCDGFAVNYSDKYIKTTIPIYFNRDISSEWFLIYFSTFEGFWISFSTFGYKNNHSISSRRISRDYLRSKKAKFAIYHYFRFRSKPRLKKLSQLIFLPSLFLLFLPSLFLLFPPVLFPRVVTAHIGCLRIIICTRVHFFITPLLNLPSFIS